jgi:hypothetical protein
METTSQSKEKEYLLEQYKAYVGNLNAIGTQHSSTRSFYVSILSALLVFLSLTGPKEEFAKMSSTGESAVAVLGIILCFAWFIHTRSFGKLFSAKFFILKKMEKRLPIQIFEEEYEKLKELKYTILTKIESLVCFAVMIPFMMMLLRVIFRF